MTKLADRGELTMSRKLLPFAEAKSCHDDECTFCPCGALRLQLHLPASIPEGRGPLASIPGGRILPASIPEGRGPLASIPGGGILPGSIPEGRGRLASIPGREGGLGSEGVSSTIREGGGATPPRQTIPGGASEGIPEGAAPLGPARGGAGRLGPQLLVKDVEVRF